MKISVLVVNLNNLQFTRDCISDLLLQDVESKITLIDQGSTEDGTLEYLSMLSETTSIDIIRNEENFPLNHLWNWFARISETPFVCLLNNDVRIAPNFLSSAIGVLEKEPAVGFVNHVTNNNDYRVWSEELNYVIIEKPYRQGWDPIFRKECFHQIPEDLHFFFGDDYIYSKLYESGMKGAYILNSPMIHFERSTTEEKGGLRDCSNDGSVFHSLNLKIKEMTFSYEFCKWKPEFTKIKRKLNLMQPKDNKTIDLSIIVCSLVERRNEFLDRLLNVLEPQISGKSNVELLVLSDNAKRPIGTKRNDGLNLANGRFVCFIDDDDMITSDYVDLVLKEIYGWNPDVIVFDALISFDGKNGKLVKYGREYDHTETHEAYHRRPNHLMVHKKENITEFFRDVKTGEDDEWASRMVDRIVTQSRINKVLYFYDYRTTTKKYFE